MNRRKFLIVSTAAVPTITMAPAVRFTEGRKSFADLLEMLRIHLKETFLKSRVLVLHFGLLRASRLFKGHIGDAEINRWRQLSQGISENLYRLFDKQQGAFLAGSKDCRQINVWANGLVYWMVNSDTQKRIAEYYYRNRTAVFKHGFTRQIAEPEGWQRHFFPSMVGNYTNGGFWSVGTGWILPVIAHHYLEFALGIAEELVDYLVKTKFREYISSDGSGGGATGFVAAIAVPMMGLTSIVENRPFSEYF